MYAGAEAPACSRNDVSFARVAVEISCGAGSGRAVAVGFGEALSEKYGSD